MPFILSVKDTYRQAVEAATGGKNTVMYDGRGNPSIMVCIPRFNLSDVIDGAPNTPHPAFIVNGVVKSEIWVSKYQNIVHDSRAYSLPGMDPATSMNFDQAKSYCVNKNGNGEDGWHLMTNAEWAAIALWSKKNNTMPRGNNNYGSDHSATYEVGRESSKTGDRTGRTATGSGPATWSHDHTDAGIFDLNGNVWEWIDGLRTVDEKIYVHKDNAFDTPDNLLNFVDTGAYFDNIGGLVLNSKKGAGTGTGTLSRKFEELVAADGYTIPELLKYLAIAPTEGNHGGDDVYANLEGEQFFRRGGYWVSTSYAGVFSLNLTGGRAHVNADSGFRSARVL